MKNYKMRSVNKSATDIKVELAPIVKRLKGIIKSDDKREYKEIVREGIFKKHSHKCAN